MKLRPAVGQIWIVLPWLACALPLLAHGAANVTTTTTTVSSQVGSTNADYIWSTLYVGPQVIPTGQLTGCTLSSPGPYPECSLGAGSGSATDPFVFNCTSSPPLTGCAGGTLFDITGGSRDIDTRIHSVRALTMQAVPLGPWVPLASAGGVLLTMLLLRRRGRRA